MTDKSQPLTEVAIVVNPGSDNVAVAKTFISANTYVMWQHKTIVIQADIRPGHRFCLETVSSGEWVVQYGQPFARVKTNGQGLEPGDPVTVSHVESITPARHSGKDTVLNAKEYTHLPECSTPPPTFMGFKRADGLVGIRNWIVVVPTSMCSSHEATQIAVQAEARGIYTRDRYPNVDGVTALAHTGGCGCPDPQPNAAKPGAYESTLLILAQHMSHPNVGAVILVELGCEKTNLQAFDEYFGSTELSARFGKPVLRLGIQDLGGTVPTIDAALDQLPELLTKANKSQRQSTPISALALGLECGGSDAFSGLTANPALGYASDLLIGCGGRSIISEVPEFYGAEHLFAARAVTPATADAIYTLLEEYKAYAAQLGHTLAENPSRGNKEGGLLNITVKSLGAIAKSGSAPVQGVLQYGEWVWDRQTAGVYMLNTPGYDPPSVTGLVGAGSQLVCFTTGRGSVFGNAIAPVLKISSNTVLYNRMHHNIDVNAGTILSADQDLPQVGQDIMDKILAVASGELTKSELTGHREFMLWNNEGIWF